MYITTTISCRPLLRNIKRKTWQLTFTMAPDTYVGGSDLIESSLPVLLDDGTIETQTFDYIPALYNTFNEILVNARDQVVRLQQLKSSNPVTAIKVSIDKDLD